MDDGEIDRVVYGARRGREVQIEFGEGVQCGASAAVAPVCDERPGAATLQSQRGEVSGSRRCGCCIRAHTVCNTAVFMMRRSRNGGSGGGWWWQGSLGDSGLLSGQDGAKTPSARSVSSSSLISELGEGAGRRG